MSVAFLELAREVEEIRAEVDAAVGGVLDRGRFILGEAVDEFERDFAAYCGAAHAVGVASGTDAIAVALEAVGVRPGDEVITAAATCVPTIAGIEAAGAAPVVVDVEPESLTLDPRAVEAALTPATRAIVPVHLYGQCADIAPIAELARGHRLALVEDAAQAHGAEYDGRRAGTLGDAAAFSFYPTKNLGAYGDAGAVVTNDADVAERARLLRNYGERDRFLSVVRGRNSRLDTLQAAVLTVKLRHLDAWNDRRRALAARYAELLDDAPVALPAELARRRHAYHLYVVRSTRRDELRAALRRRGIETLVHYPRPVHHQPAYSGLARAALPVSERAAREVLSLPLYPQLTDPEVEEVARGVVASSRELDGAPVPS